MPWAIQDPKIRSSVPPWCRVVYYGFFDEIKQTPKGLTCVHKTANGICTFHRHGCTGPILIKQKPTQVKTANKGQPTPAVSRVDYPLVCQVCGAPCYRSCLKVECTTKGCTGL